MKSSPMESAEVNGGAAGQHRLVEDLNAGYIRSVATGDDAWFQDNLAEDFSSSGADGSLLDKKAFIEQVVRPSGISGLTVNDVHIRILGDTAIVHGWTKYRKMTGESAAGRYTDIWLLRNGRWKCIAAHVTRG
jgi:ketosteroid isomerase-like protein